MQKSRSDTQKSWKNKDVRNLIQQRRSERNPYLRSCLSKELRKTSRQEMRKWKTMRAHAILQKFENLNDLQKLREVPRKSSSNDAPENDVFADFLAHIYSSDAMELTWDVNLIQQISEFSFCELLDAINDMRNGKAEDKNGMALEMIKYASHDCHLHLLNAYNMILRDVQVDDQWYGTTSRMLPKSGDLKDPGKWRPIAVLPIL